MYEDLVLEHARRAAGSPAGSSATRRKGRPESPVPCSSRHLDGKRANRGSAGHRRTGPSCDADLSFQITETTAQLLFGAGNLGVLPVVYCLWYMYDRRYKNEGMIQNPPPQKVPLIFFRTGKGAEPVREWLKELQKPNVTP